MARALGVLLENARALQATDLVTPGDVASARPPVLPGDPAIADTLNQRANTIATLFENRRSALGAAGATTAELTAALIAAADFMADAFPAIGTPALAIAASAAAVKAELDRRTVAHNTIAGQPAPTPDDLIAQSVGRIEALCGAGFVVLPSIHPPAGAELDQTLGARTDLLAGDDGSAPIRFVQQASQVYEGLGRWRTVSLYAGASSAPKPRLDIGQLPHTPGSQWLGMKLGPGKTPPPGRVSLLVYGYGSTAPSATTTWRGLLLDEWVEVIPNAVEDTGLTFHFDNPGAEAPQAVLVVAPSSIGATWKASDVWGTLAETLDLAKIRAVDLELVKIAQFLPAISLAQSTAKTTVSTSFAGDVRIVEV
jgi:hypothetical protein